jgi:hypothetical protein
VGEEEEALGESEQKLRLLFDIVVFGGDSPDAADDLCKEIGSRLRRLLRIQMYTDDYPEATQLDGFAEGGDIGVDPQVIFATYQNSAGWWAEGATGATVTIYSQE